MDLSMKHQGDPYEGWSDTDSTISAGSRRTVESEASSVDPDPQVTGNDWGDLTPSRLDIVYWHKTLGRFLPWSPRLESFTRTTLLRSELVPRISSSGSVCALYHRNTHRRFMGSIPQDELALVRVLSKDKSWLGGYRVDSYDAITIKLADGQSDNWGEPPILPEQTEQTEQTEVERLEELWEGLTGTLKTLIAQLPASE